MSSKKIKLALLEPEGDPEHRMTMELARAQDEASDIVLRHDILNWMRSELMESDLRALENDSRKCLDADLEMLDHGLAKAGGSAAASAMVAKAVEEFSRRNARLLRRYHE